MIARAIVAAEPSTGHRFDGPDLVWQLDNEHVQTHILAHEHVKDGARNRDGCEHLIVAAPAGQSVLIRCPTLRVAVLDELQIRMWVKASRPDAELAAHVTMPRSVDAQGRPATVVVRGARYSRLGQWQQLSLQDVPKLLAAEVRVLRSSSRTKIDPREAFIDAVLIVVPGEPRGVELWADELEVDGVISAADGVRMASFPPPSELPTGAQPARADARPPDVIAASAVGARAESPVRLQRSLLLVEGKPFMPRVIQWQGEPFQFLAELGFNAIELPAPPSPDQVAEAQRHDLWFICSAPKRDAIAQHGIGQAGDRVLTWLLNDEALEADRQYGRGWAETIRQRDAVAGRPILIAPEADWEAASTIADILLVRHPRFGQLSEADYDQWLTSRRRLADPGVPLWSVVATQFGEQVQQQGEALSGSAPSPPGIDAAQIDRLVRVACRSEIRGFFFASNSPLDEENREARQRAGALELLNHRLRNLEPWLAGGKVVSRLSSTNSAWSGIVLHVDRARLLTPIAPKSTAGHTGARGAERAPREAEIAFVVPGVPESSQVYILTAARLKPLTAHRVTGGTHIVVPADEEAMVLVTEDPQVVQAFRQRLARDAPQALRIRRQLAEERAKQVADTLERLARLGYRNEPAARGIGSLSLQLRQCDALLSAGRIEEAFSLVESINRSLVHTAAEQRRMIGQLEAIGSYPTALSYEQLAAHAEFVRTFATRRGGENLLYGGDFEDLGQMTQFGWQHVSHSLPGVDARAKLAADNPQHGKYCLELFAGGTSPTAVPADVASPPVWIVSPPIPVDSGQIIEITGWARVDGSIAGGIDGLQIVDSLGGPELALAIQRTSGWAPFQIIRGASETSELRLTFVLTGLGKACVDGVMIRTLEKPVARRLPALSPADVAPPTETADSGGPLFVAPETR